MINCGQCLDTFADEASYLAHICPETGVDPTHPATMGPEFEQIQAAALERGAERLEDAPQPEKASVAVQPGTQTPIDEPSDDQPEESVIEPTFPDESVAGQQDVVGLPLG